MTEPTKVCRTCKETKALTEFQPDGDYQDGRRHQCRACMATYSNTRYHANTRARAIQLGGSHNQNVRRKWPAADTGMTSAEYAELVLAMTECTYCGQPNDGTYAFNLDHRIPLARGGKHEAANLTPCCEPCNRAKHKMTDTEYRIWLAGVAQRQAKAS
jgi:5-methylcytosine-specific restriction endonuclease McrA